MGRGDIELVKILYRNKSGIILVGLVIAVALTAVAGHVYLGERREDATGTLALLDHVFDFVFALALSGVLTSTGHEVCERLRLKFVSSAEEIGFSLFVGSGIVGLALLLLGLMSWLRPVPVSLLIIICLIASRRSLRHLLKVVPERLGKLWRNTEAKLPVAIFVCLLIILILRAASPPSAADEVIYHLPVPRDFVRQGRIYPIFDNSLGNFPMLIHMIYALCLMAGTDIAPRLFSLILAVGVSLAIFGFCSRYLTRRVAAIALFAFFGAGMVVEVAVTSRIDVSLAGMLFLCTYGMVNYLDTRNRGWLWLSALLAGFSLGIKHTAAIWLALIGLMYLVHLLVINRERIAQVIGLGILYALLAFAVASPWYIKNYVWFHNPFYPLFTGEVAEYGPNGIRYFDANDERRIEAFFNAARSEMPDVVKAQEKELMDAINSRIERHPLRWWEFFLRPNAYLMSETSHYPNYLFLFIPFLIFLKKPRWIVWLLVLSVGFVFAVTWSSWIARYLLPAYPALTIVAVYTLETFAKSKTRVLRGLPIYAVAAAVGIAFSAGVHALIIPRSLNYLLGKTSRLDTVRQLTYYRPIDFINTQLPSNARIFIVGVQLHYGIKREYLTDETWFATKWRRVMIRNDSYEGINEDLKRQGFTHIFFTPDLFKFAAWMGMQGTGGMEMISPNNEQLSEEARRLGPEYQLLRNWSTFTMYKRKFLEVVYSDDNRYEVLKLK
jgi:hypothetical protein